MPAPVPVARVVRSGVEESVHLGSVAAVDATGVLLAWAGDPGRVAFLRSAAKPLQAAVSLSYHDEDLPEREVAIMCASHPGRPAQVEAVLAILARAGLGPGDLRCPPALPLDEDARLRAEEPRPEYHNCSGKHAGMLLACVRTALDRATYVDPGHPLQHRVLQAVAAAAGSGPVAVGVDGCGVPVHAFPLAAVARAFGALASPEPLGELAGPARRAVRAMLAQPELVAGAGRLETDLMRAAPEILVKGGAEGLVCAAHVPTGLGVAVKVEDGAARAVGPALVRALRRLDLLDEGQEVALAAHARPPVRGGGRRVGDVVASFDLERA